MIENCYYERDKFKMYKPRKGLTILEMVMAIGIIAAIFAALLPQFVNINNSWASRQGNLETLQVERIVTSHLRDRIAVAKRIIAVSDPDDDDGFLEYEDIDGITYRYELSGGDLVFGPVGNMAILAESVTKLKFKCYALDDLDDKITDVDQIRFIKAKMKIDKPSGGSETVAVSVYLRTGVSEMTGLLGWWKLDDASGLVAADSSGYDNHATLTNMTGNEWTGGVLAGALEFDGTNDYMGDADGEDYINGLTAVTISVWIQSNLIGTNRGIILGEVPSNNDVFSLRYDELGKWGGGTNGIKAGFVISGIPQQIESSSNVQITGWQHLAVTWSSGNQLALYIDGSIDSPIYNDVAQTGTTSGADALFIGRGPKAIGDVWDGQIDDIRIYDRVLSAEEIAALANILKYKESTETKVAVDTTSITISTPSGTDEDDLLIAAVATDGSTSVSLLAPGGEGWTEINTSNYLGRVSLGAWWKLADASESPDHQFTWSGAEQAYGWMMRFTGHDPANPINTYTSGGSSSSTPISPSVTTTVGNALILRLGAFDENDITTDDPGLSGHTVITMDASASEVTYEEFTEAKRSSNGTSLTINKPAGTSENDLLVAAVVTDGDTRDSLVPPGSEGWNQISVERRSGDVTLGVWWKLADAPESPTHQFTWSGSEKAYGWIMRFTGHDQANPIHRSAANEGGSTTTPTCPAVTTTIANCMIVRIGGFDDDDVSVDNTGLFGHTDITMDKSSNGNGTCSGGAGYVIQASAGASGTSNFSLNSGEEYRAITIAIAPGGSGADSVSGGAGYVKQSLSGNSGTSEFSLTASQESRMLTIGIAQDPASGGSLMP